MKQYSLQESEIIKSLFNVGTLVTEKANPSLILDELRGTMNLVRDLADRQLPQLPRDDLLVRLLHTKFPPTRDEVSRYCTAYTQLQRDCYTGKVARCALESLEEYHWTIAVPEFDKFEAEDCANRVEDSAGPVFHP
ncbi:hypothetical protein CAOG_009978 [Capsaspora owczarzaki ATCC 30864]|uniref:Uncharacterized protein n=1 Tax=Capsaspora owczarzaki (strain ATCC 30864) TaxID=595528 RepID=A0A0D2VWI5_CAPO3|nr:hypothetical protein CAOG_009978 [Capsaspora owczarzaki ATCC 30864]